MNYKEEAKRLIDRFNSLLTISRNDARILALIHLDEMIKELEENWMSAPNSYVLIKDLLLVRSEILC